MSNDLAATEETKESQLVSMISKLAMSSDVDVEKLERLMNMQERMLKREAEQQYTLAMVKVQGEMSAVTKDKFNGQTQSKFVSLEALKKAITPVYTKHGFAVSFGEGDSPKEHHIRVTCKVMHSSGHSEHFFYDSPIDDKGIKGNINKTATHAKASAVTYGERYILKLIFNLTIQDEDDDGNAAGGEPIRVCVGPDETTWSGTLSEAIEQFTDTINVIKEGIATGDLESAAEAWFELTQAEQLSLWVAERNGGPFSHSERKVIKEELRAIYYASDDDIPQ